MTFRVKWNGFLKYNFLPQNNKGCFVFLGGSYVSRGDFKFVNFLLYLSFHMKENFLFEIIYTSLLLIID
jgi:hypothetical protein